jgi:hypothetical protein
MSVEALRTQVIAMAGSPPSLLCITGAGAGKTHAIESLRTRIAHEHLPTLAFDSLGVPSPEQMIAGWESGRGWQKAMTWHWVQTAKNVFRTHPLVVLEGSFDPQYAIAACAANRMRFAVVLLHANDDTSEWARYLHEQARQLGCHVVDAGTPEVVDALCAHALTLLAAEPAEPPRPRRN